MKPWALSLLPLVLAACTSRPAAQGPEPERLGVPVVLVTLGGDETAGSDLGFPEVVRSRWPQIVFRDALPTRAVWVNLSREGLLVADALRAQADLVTADPPTIVTVWFGHGDELAGTPVATFERELRDVVDPLVEDGASVYVVTGRSDLYEDAISAVIVESGAIAIDLTDLPRPLGIAGHAEAARRVAEAIGTVE